MPPKPPRRRADSGAGPAITDERTLIAVPTSSPSTARPRRKFTALLDAESEARYARLLADVRAAVGPIATRSDGAGRVRTGYDLSRADLLRALLAIAEHDPGVRDAVHAQVRADLSPGTTRPT